MNGKLIYARIDEVSSGNQEIELSASDFHYSGVLYVQIITPSQVLKKQILKLAK